MAASELKSYISNANLGKNKKRCFYILILAMQTKQINIFSYVVNINENLKKTDEKKCCFKRV